MSIYYIEATVLRHISFSLCKNPYGHASSKQGSRIQDPNLSLVLTTKAHVLLWHSTVIKKDHSLFCKTSIFIYF